MIRNDSGEVSFHGLILFKRKSKNGEKNCERKRKKGKKWENLEQSNSEGDHPAHNHKIDELAKGKRT